MNFFRSKHSKPKQPPSTDTASAAEPVEQTLSNNGLTLEYFQAQLLLDCLTRIVYGSNDHEQLIAMAFEQVSDNPTELRMLRELEAKYSSDRALWWYLQDCFLYKIINYSLESQDIRNLYLLRRVLHDLDRQMQEHRCSTPLHVYRSQLMPMELLSQWISSVGQCVVINSFLSATTNHEVALTYLNSTQTLDNNYERVLLEIDADPRIRGSKSFVHLDSLNYAKDKNEVLFMFGSIFLINNITCGNDGVYTIELTLYSDNDHEFKQIFDDMRKKSGSGELNLLTFAQVLYDLDRFDEAEEYLHHYIDQLPAEHDDLVRCHNLLGVVAMARADFETSLMWYNQVLQGQIRRLSKQNDPRLADTHESIGEVYCKQGSYDLALKHYMTSLEMKSASLPTPHPSLAGTLENLGRIHECKRDFPQAIAYLQEASAMYRHLPATTTNEKVVQIEEHIRRITQRMK